MTGDRDRAWAAMRQSPQQGLATIGSRRDPWSDWARGVLAMATGTFDRSFDILMPLCEIGGEVAGLACARIASGLRQIDEHAAAVDWDERAVAGEGQAVTDGLIGRAADAVGAGDQRLAAHQLSRAHRRVGQMRDEVRVAWVACEISLLKGHFAVAAAHAERSHRLSKTMGSPRHVVKSALFWAAAVRPLDHDLAFELLDRAYGRAKGLALRPLLWPLVAVLGDEASREQRVEAGQAVRYIHTHLPPGYGGNWAQRADIAELRLTA